MMEPLYLEGMREMGRRAYRKREKALSTVRERKQGDGKWEGEEVALDFSRDLTEEEQSLLR